MKNQTEEALKSYVTVADVSKVMIHFSLYKKVRNQHWVVRGGKGTKVISTLFDILTSKAAIFKHFVMPPPPGILGSRIFLTKLPKRDYKC